MTILKTEKADWEGKRGDKWNDSLSQMEAMLRPINKPLIELLNLKHSCSVADIGCGGGQTALEVYSHAPEGTKVYGFDISSKLIESANSNLAHKSEHLVYTVCDVAKSMPKPNAFDKLYSRFGVMFFAQPEQAFLNLSEWLVPGGEVVFAVWDSPQRNPWIRIVKEVVGQLVNIPTMDPDLPGPFRYSNKEVFFKILSKSGFRKLQVKDWTESIQIGGGLNAKNASEFAIASFGIAEHLFESGNEAVNEGKLRLEKEFQKYEKAGKVTLKASVLFFTGIV